MCGIIGVIAGNTTGITYKEQSMFEQLLYVDALRGEDSTGVFCVSKDAAVKVVKSEADAYTFQYYNEYKDIVDYIYKEGMVAIGHNRKSTVGKSVDTNAHPFVVEDELVFVHNGTLYNHRKWADTDVDSEALAIHIHKALRSEEEDALDKAFSEVYGAFACVFYDQVTEKLYLIRNSQRPLWLVRMKNGSYLISSEPGFAYAIANRNDGQIDESFQLEPSHLYTFDLSKKIEKPHVRKLKDFFTVAPAGNTYRGYKTGKNMAPTMPAGAHSEASKNAFRRLRNKILNRRVNFVVEDYVEKYPEKEESEWLVWGILEQNVHVKESFLPNKVSLEVSNLRMKTFMDGYEGILTGMVTEVVFNNGEILISLTDPLLPEELKYVSTPSVH